MPLFSVVICTFKRYDLLPKAIESVLAQDLDPSLFDIWVVDNTPDPAARAKGAEQFGKIPRLTYIERPVPGLSAARNDALLRAEGDWVVFLDDDAVASPGWLSAYKKAIEQIPADCAALGGRVSLSFLAPRPCWLHDSLLPILSCFEWEPRLCPLPETASPIGANLALHRETAKACGGFNQALGRQGDGTTSLLSGEENRLLGIMHALHKSIYYVPEASVQHLVPPERLTRSWFRRRAAWQAVSDQSSSSLPEAAFLQFWANLSSYLTKVPAEQAPFMGLFWDTDDPALFAEQFRSLYALNRICLATGSYPREMQALDAL